MSDDADVSAAPTGPLLFHIAERVLNRPLLIHPSKAEVILHVLEGRLPLGGYGLAPLPADANSFIGTNRREDGSFRMNRAKNGVAIIPITGSLVNRGAWIGAHSGLTSYEGISAQLRDAANDPDVSSILLDIDSPGGEATGMFSLAEQVRQLGQSKAVTAFVNDMAASAAYGIASAANEIVVSPTSIVGSIGVVLTHMDRSGQLAKDGVKPTLIYAGAHKVDGNPFGPLSETVQADLQAEVAKFYDQFVSLVNRGRARMTEQTIRATEARTYIGADAISRGLADRMASLDQVLTQLAKPAVTTPKAKPEVMQRSTPKAKEPKVDQTFGARLRSILELPQARNRWRQALAIAFETSSSAKEASILLAALPEDKARGFPHGGTMFPSSVIKHDAAAQRITVILKSAEAEGREKQAVELALGTSLPLAQVLALLGEAPRVAAYPTIAERAAQEAEFGGSIEEERSVRRSDAIWKKAIQKANAAVTGAPSQAVPMPPAPPKSWSSAEGGDGARQNQIAAETFLEGARLAR